jgi:hypothetical protein
MFRGLINDAKSAAGTVVAKYAVRASTAVPFVIALGFATAGSTLMLVERFGHREAYVMIAAGFTAVGLLAVLVVRSKEIDGKQCQRMNEMAGRKPMSAELDARRNIEHSISRCRKRTGNNPDANS